MKRSLLFVMTYAILAGLLFVPGATSQTPKPAARPCPVTLGFNRSSPWDEGTDLATAKVEFFYPKPVFFAPAWCNVTLRQGERIIPIKTEKRGWRLKFRPAKKLQFGSYVLLVGDKKYYIKISPP